MMDWNTVIADAITETPCDEAQTPAAGPQVETLTERVQRGVHERIADAQPTASLKVQLWTAACTLPDDRVVAQLATDRDLLRRARYGAASPAFSPDERERLAAYAEAVELRIGHLSYRADVLANARRQGGGNG